MFVEFPGRVIENQRNQKPDLKRPEMWPRRVADQVFECGADPAIFRYQRDQFLDPTVNAT